MPNHFLEEVKNQKVCIFSTLPGEVFREAWIT